MPALRIRLPGEPEREVPLEGREFRIGRADECEIVVQESDISREHAVLKLGRGGFVIEDLGSRNGMFVNGERVERHDFAPGDTVRLGRAVELELIDEDRSRDRRGHVAREREAPAPPPRRSGGPLGWLKLESWALQPEGRGAETIRLDASRVTVGREKSARVSIDDESVSRLHARIDRDAEGLVVTDLKSRNGTLVNGEAVLQSPLEEGDEVQFGDIPFTVVRKERLAVERLGLALLAGVLVVGAVFGLRALSDRLTEDAAVRSTRARIHRQALTNLGQGIDAWERGEADIARAHLLFAADVLQMAGLAPPGATLDEPAKIFRNILGELPAAQRQFDFSAALDPAAAATSRAKLESLSDRDYVLHETRRISIELGQDADVPEGFVEEVWRWVDRWIRLDRGSFQTWLNRSRTIQPDLRRTLSEAHLPEVFCYVSWVESGLNPRAQSPVGAVGLWQFMVPTARQYGLRVDPGAGVDERTDVRRSTAAAAQYIANLLRKFGPEQFMCALASYNRGEGGVWRSMEKIPDPMMPSSQKYWYLVEHDLIPDETSKYVPKIFAAAILAGNPERFGFERP